MTKRIVALALALILAALTGIALRQPPAPEARPLPPVIQPLAGAPQIALLPPSAVNTLPRLAPQVTGLATATPEGLQHDWPGLHLRARFTGTALRLLFDDAANRFRLSLDGRPVAILTRPGNQVVDLTGLPPGPHDIALEKLSESPGPALFGGVFLPPGSTALPPPAPAPRLFDFIGDSDSVGYANTASNRACTPDTVFLATDSSAAFGPRTAAQFGADYRLIARSGLGLVRNYDGADPGRTMTTLYPPPPAPPPQIIVIALGSNDFSTPLRDGEPWPDAAALRADFTRALIAFTRQRHAAAPKAQILLLVFTEYGADILAAHQAAQAELASTGLATTLVPLPKLGRHACDWHPTLDDHALIAQTLIDAITAPPAP